MRDIDKTKEQLIGELAQIHQRIAELEASEAQQEQMKGALQESERRYRLLAENAKDAIWTVDMNMRPTYMSPSITDLLGYTVEEAIASPMEAVYTPASFEIAMKVLAEELAIENMEQKDLSRSRTVELELNRKDGSIVPIEGKFTFLRDSDGRPVEILVIARDITNRKQAERALMNSEEQYRQLIENLHEGVWVIDKDAYTSFVNHRMAEMLGYTVDEMLGKHFFSFMDQYGVEIATRSLERRKQGIKEQHDFEFLRKDGIPVYTIVETSPITDEEGNYAGAIAGVQDITQRKQMEETLQESEKRYRELANFLPQIVFETDEQANLTFANRRGFEAYGYTSEDFTKGLNALQMLIPEDRDRGRENIQRVLNGENVGSTEYTALRKDGNTFPVLIYSALISRGNKPVGLRGLIIDITERKQMEEVLRESEERFRSLTESTSDWIWEVDTNGIYTYASPKVKDLLGYEPEEVIGRTPFDMMPPEEVSRIADAFRVIVESQRPFDRLENTNLHKDGQLVILETSGVPFFDANGRLCGYRGIDRNITERKRIEEALRETEERYRDLLENANDLIQSVMPDGHFLYVNKMWQKTLGYSEEEITDLRLWDIIHPDFIPRCREVFQKVMSGEQQNNVEAVFITKDGKSVTVEGNVNCRFKGEVPVATRGIFRDITKRKKGRGGASGK